MVSTLGRYRLARATHTRYDIFTGACGEGKCIEKETGFDCYCPYGKTGPRCERSVKIYQPAFNDDKAFIAHDTPKALRRQVYVIVSKARTRL